MFHHLGARLGVSRWLTPNAGRVIHGTIMDSCGFESRTVQPVVCQYTVNTIASAKLMFLRLSIEKLCGSGATVL